MKLGDARVFSVPTFSSDTAPRGSTSLDRWVLGRIRASVSSARLRFVLWDGFELPYAGDAPVGTIVFRNRRALFSWVWNPDLNFGEAYMFGAVELQGDLVAMLVRDLPRAAAHAPAAAVPRSSRRTTSGAARENVHHHYDLGNDFYRLWLDREMLYTCAYFPTPTRRSRTAQIAKMDHVCRKLRAAARRARRRGRLRLGLAGAVHGEAVRRHGPRLQRLVRADRLRARPCGGRGADGPRRVRRGRLSQRAGALRRLRLGRHARARRPRGLSATFGARHRSLARRAPAAGCCTSSAATSRAPLNPWIRKRIFPGAYPPTLPRDGRARARAVEPLGARRREPPPALRATLDHWRRRFEAASDEVRPDVRRAFVRAWRLYLAGSQAAFATGTMQLFQVVFARGGSNDIPWTRLS